MNNETIKKLLERVKNGQALTADEQIRVLQGLLRANHRIQAAKRAGYNEVEPNAKGSTHAEPNTSMSNTAKGSANSSFLPPRL